MSPAAIPVSCDRVLAGALRLSLLPIVQREEAIAEVLHLAGRRPTVIRDALEQLRHGGSPGAISAAARRAERLLGEALCELFVAGFGQAVRDSSADELRTMVPSTPGARRRS